MDSNTTTEAPTVNQETAPETTDTTFAVDDKFKSYWKSQGIKDESFKDAATFNQAVIDRYAKAIEKRQANPEPQAQTQTQAQAPAQAPAQTDNQNLTFNAMTYGLMAQQQFTALKPEYLAKGDYLNEMVQAGMSPIVNGQLNTSAINTFLNMKNQTATAEKALEDLKTRQAQAQPQVNPQDQMYGAAPDNGEVKEMSNTAVNNIMLYNLNHPRHSQTQQAALYAIKHSPWGKTGR